MKANATLLLAATLACPALGAESGAAPSPETGLFKDFSASSANWTLRRTLYLELPWDKTSRVIDDAEGANHGPGEFVVDSKGRVVIADVNAQKLRMYGTDRRLLKTAKIERGILLDVALDRQGLIYALAWDDKVHGFRVAVYGSELAPLRAFAAAAGNALRSPAYFAGMRTADLIEVDAQGKIYVYDHHSRKTSVFDPAGRPLETFPDEFAARLRCRGRLHAAWTREGVWVRGVNVATLEGKAIWSSPREGAYFYGCDERFAMVRVSGDPKAKQPKNSFYIIGVQSGSIDAVALGALHPRDPFLQGSVVDETASWISLDGALYQQFEPFSDAFRIYKTVLLPKTP